MSANYTPNITQNRRLYAHTWPMTDNHSPPHHDSETRRHYTSWHLIAGKTSGCSGEGRGQAERCMWQPTSNKTDRQQQPVYTPTSCLQYAVWQLISFHITTTDRGLRDRLLWGLSWRVDCARTCRRRQSVAQMNQDSWHKVKYRQSTGPVDRTDTLHHRPAADQGYTENTAPGHQQDWADWDHPHTAWETTTCRPYHSTTHRHNTLLTVL